MHLGALARMARPGNALMAAAGVVVGAALVAGWQAHWLSVGLAAASAILGLAAGNILNDLHDVEIDRRAHPERPLVRGDVSFEQASRACGLLLVLALAVAAAINLVVLILAGVLVVCLIAYEAIFKKRGLIGNVWISLVVAGTFALGAAAATLPPLSYAPQAPSMVLTHPRWVVALVLSVLPFLANLGREIFKDVEDAPADAGTRRTLPLHMGWRRAMNVGRMALAAAIVYAGAGVVRHADLGAAIWLDAFLLLPCLLVFLVAMLQREGRPAQLWTKAGMALALGGLFGIGVL